MSLSELPQQVFGTAFVPNHDSIKFFPLNIINGSNAMPAALTTAETLMFSQLAPQKIT